MFSLGSNGKMSPKRNVFCLLEAVDNTNDWKKKKLFYFFNRIILKNSGRIWFQAQKYKNLQYKSTFSVPYMEPTSVIIDRNKITPINLFISLT